MCLVNAAIEDALNDAAEAYAAQDVRVEARLEATLDLDTHPGTLYQALYTIFACTPHRVARGSVVRIRTEDRAGRDIEVTWERKMADDTPEGDGLALQHLLGDGRHGDLMELALLALEHACHARTGHFAITTSEEPLLADSAADVVPGVYRRVLALIPSRTHQVDAYVGDLDSRPAPPGRAASLHRAQ